MPPMPPVTKALILACVGMFCLGLLIPPQYKVVACPSEGTGAGANCVTFANSVAQLPFTVKYLDVQPQVSTPPPPPAN